MGNRTKRFAKLFSQYLPSATVFKCGLALLIICTVAAFVMAYYHDAYSSILELKELAATDVWFKLFVILMVLGAALLVGSTLLAMILAGITMLFPTKEPELIEEDVPAVDEEVPATEQQEHVIINEARLRDIFGSVFMHEWLDEENSISYLDQLIEDLQYVRDHFKKAAKQDDQHYCINNIIEIAYLLDKPEYVKKPFGSFPKLCRAVFDCMRLTRPKSIKNHPVVAEHVKKRFYYLL